MFKDLIKLITLVFIFTISSIGSTGAYFSDTASSTNNIVATYWEVEPGPTPMPVPKIILGSVVINEVYYDVAEDKGTENKNEWIELYNLLNAPVYLKNWKLVDGGGNTKNINPEVSIPAYGFAVLSHDSSTWSSYWPLPEGAIIVNLTGSQAWLNNNGDKLILKDSENNEVDWVAWENYVTGWNLNADEGQSIARKTKGVDTDSPADWETLSIPNPGTNPHSSSIEDSPKLYLTFSEDKRSVSFKVYNIKNFTRFSYELTYDTDTISDGVIGSVDLPGESEYEKSGITLGTCSSGGTCTYYTGVKNIKLIVKLENSEGSITTLEKTLP